jgi:hypothetical protein
LRVVVEVDVVVEVVTTAGTGIVLVTAEACGEAVSTKAMA